jgi:PiT family inorganic phosphate transporter
MPVSTTHVITSTILGVGLSKRITAVNWTVAGRILVAFLTYDILSPFLGK